MTAMTYSSLELSRGNAIFWSANRLQYMTNEEKTEYSTQMFDRGLITQNMVMDIWHMPHVPGGDRYFIRKEYIEMSKLGETDEHSTEEHVQKGDEDDTEGQDEI